ncbi:3'-5' exonuclease [Shewanella cutis]|uniref:3'-5' exonuclease n=1 Tax=Shewanella cutis TaxID=2766780 RepID=A0ABS9QW70_9GAMM|nr:3'-5' exonuclease [Shewanella sp. PS-2]MCG9964587.1 3'-5' exonuclease [Shewanella sp. PS-2]
MSLILPFDTETTGLPDWKSPSEADHQPHLVQLAALLVNDKFEIVKELDVIIKPNGWIIPDEVAAIHGITTERAMDEGIPEQDALAQLLEMAQGALRIAHNKTFDQRIIRIATKRYSDEATQEAWANKDNFECTIRMYQKQFGGKNTDLATCYEKLTGKKLENAHSAMADTKACFEVYKAIVLGANKAA